MSEHDNLQNADGKNDEEKRVEETVTHSDTSSQSTKDASEEVSEDTSEDTVLEEIEASNAEDAEDEGNSERHTIEVKDYHDMSLEELVNELDHLVSTQKTQAIKKHVEEIKTEFNTKFGALLDEKKELFISEGGQALDFHYSSPFQKRFRDIYKSHKGNLHTHYKNLESSLKDNLASRLEIIEAIKALMNDAEDSMNTKYRQFKDLQERWKNAGPIPRDKYNNAWNSYHFNVEKFYDLLHLDRDLRDKDFEHNLEQKTKIAESAEELAEDDDTNRAFRELQVLHKLWKEDLGPVAKEHREVIWERFKNATKKIHDKRQVYFSKLDEIYEQNLKNKHSIIEKIEEQTNSATNAHNVLQNKIKIVEGLREEFFKAGKVPIKVNEATWAKFKTAVRDFNRNKNAFYKDLKKEQLLNLEKKTELVNIAEANKDSEDFEATTQLMKKIQGDWKHIGHVPRKDSDKIWKRFKSACNHYFDRINEQRNAANEEENGAFEEKTKLIEELKTIKLSGDQKEDLSTIKNYISKWKSIGRVPGNKRQIESSFNKTLDALFKSLDLNKEEAELIKFENKLQDLSSAKDPRVLDNERLFIRKKVDEIKGEINQLENNLQFFSNVNDTNPLVQDVHKNIERHKESLTLWKTKLRKIKELYTQK